MKPITLLIITFLLATLPARSIAQDLQSHKNDVSDRVETIEEKIAKLEKTHIELKETISRLEKKVDDTNRRLTILTGTYYGASGGN
ncbi:coil containing protein [Vibrio phage 2.275.O._10N.286.54.E11]|nr:coil containing protein [Vibrio phage 2.275.O._10N.286.54.E11]